MSALVWDQVGQRQYETGVDHGVLYPFDTEQNKYGTGVAWNGLTEVDQKPEGGELTDFWADNMKYAGMRSAEDFKFTIAAYMTPDEFEECDGSTELAPGVTIGQQDRKPFGMAYRTRIGSDTDQAAANAYKLHLIYGASANPSERQYKTVNDNPDATTLSYDCDTVPVPVTGHKPTAIVEIDSRRVDAKKLKAIEAKLYGDEANEPTLPTPDEIAALLAE